MVYVLKKFIKSNFIHDDEKNKRYHIQNAVVYGSDILVNYFDKFDAMVIGGIDGFALEMIASQHLQLEILKISIISMELY